MIEKAILSLSIFNKILYKKNITKYFSVERNILNTTFKMKKNTKMHVSYEVKVTYSEKIL